MGPRSRTEWEEEIVMRNGPTIQEFIHMVGLMVVCARASSGQFVLHFWMEVDDLIWRHNGVNSTVAYIHRVYKL